MGPAVDGLRGLSGPHKCATACALARPGVYAISTSYGSTSELLPHRCHGSIEPLAAGDRTTPWPFASKRRRCARITWCGA